MQFADVAFFAGDSGKELGWAHAAVLCAVSPYFRQLLLGPKSRSGPPFEKPSVVNHSALAKAISPSPRLKGDEAIKFY